MATTVSRHVTLARATIALHTRPQPVIAVRCCCGPRRRHLSHSSLTQAKLVDPHVSIIPGQVNSLPPTAPLPQPLSSSSSPSSSSNRAQTQSRSTSKHARVAHKRDLGSIVAFDLFLLRLVHQLGNKLGKAQPPPPPLPTLFHQSTARAGKQLDHVLKYESTPSQDRRVRTTAPNDAARAVSPGDIHDGIVVVAHVIGGDDPLVSVCSGFAVGSADDQGPVQILTCHHTLDQVTRVRSSFAGSTRSSRLATLRCETIGTRSPSGRTSSVARRRRRRPPSSSAQAVLCGRLPQLQPPCPRPTSSFSNSLRRQSGTIVSSAKKPSLALPLLPLPGYNLCQSTLTPRQSVHPYLLSLSAIPLRGQIRALRRTTGLRGPLSNIGTQWGKKHA